jgi:enamine deaminase RidA (YjgF/YER057c/UK114 family)
MPTPVNPPHFPLNPLYSQGMLAPADARTLYVSGQVGIGPDGRPASGVAEQARLAIANLNAVLEAAGMNAGHIVKMTIYLTDEADLPGFMQAAGGTLPSPPPATTLLIVKGLASPELLVEIEAIAVG